MSGRDADKGKGRRRVPYASDLSWTLQMPSAAPSIMIGSFDLLLESFKIQSIM